MKITIISETQDIFAKYKAIYTGEKKLVSSPASYGSVLTTLNSGDEIYVDTDCVRNPELEGEIECDGIFSVYALNRDKGCLLTITKIN